MRMRVRRSPALQTTGAFLFGTAIMTLFSLIGCFLLLGARYYFREGSHEPGLAFLAFGSMFVTAGTAGLWGSFRERRVHRRDLERKSAHPDEPWLWYDEWRDGGDRAFKLGFRRRSEYGRYVKPQRGARGWTSLLSGAWRYLGAAASSRRSTGVRISTTGGRVVAGLVLAGLAQLAWLYGCATNLLLEVSRPPKAFSVDLLRSGESGPPYGIEWQTRHNEPGMVDEPLGGGSFSIGQALPGCTRMEFVKARGWPLPVAPDYPMNIGHFSGAARSPKDLWRDAVRRDLPPCHVCFQILRMDADPPDYWVVAVDPEGDVVARARIDEDRPSDPRYWVLLPLAFAWDMVTLPLQYIALAWFSSTLPSG